jgi:hypothetical protein
MTISFGEFLKNSSDAFLPTPIKTFLYKDFIGNTNNTFYISGWSIMHFISGIFIGVLYFYFNFNTLFYFRNMLITHSFWELWQIIIGTSKPYKLTGRSNLIDTIIDTILFMAGAFLWKYLKAF